MHTKGFHPILFLAVFVILVSTACNIPLIGQINFNKPETSSDVLVANSANGSPVNKLNDVHKAVIQIEAQGTFLDPQFGLEVNAAGRGSGFIIDPSGIAVTNNHVVTGAALVKVWIDGEKEPRNAKVLGYSECNDLAVIKIDGSNFSYLNWYDDDVSTGLEIYLAGFPLGEPEFSLTKGIISKERTTGNTSWTAVTGGVLAHDATSNPGNSGGPLVDNKGRVVGINFAGHPDTNQYFAISAATAKPIVNKLIGGENFESIGINGTIVSSDDNSISGVWVSSVASGSAADKAGLKPGDIILQVEGLVVGKDGTMNDYCSVIRTHDANTTLSIKVLRWETKEVLEGQLNGRPLKVLGTTSITEATQIPSSENEPTQTPSTKNVFEIYPYDGSKVNYKIVIYGDNPGTISNQYHFSSGEKIGVSSWCATTKDGLIGNLENINISISINGQPINTNEIKGVLWQNDNLFCAHYGGYFLLPDGSYNFRIITTFLKEVSDGATVYPAGEYIFDDTVVIE
jgi:S1-C subfamily serine protease